MTHKFRLLPSIKQQFRYTRNAKRSPRKLLSFNQIYTREKWLLVSRELAWCTVQKYLYSLLPLGDGSLTQLHAESKAGNNQVKAFVYQGLRCAQSMIIPRLDEADVALMMLTECCTRQHGPRWQGWHKNHIRYHTDYPYAEGQKILITSSFSPFLIDISVVHSYTVIPSTVTQLP